MKIDYRAAVGPKENYDILGAHQFMLMVMLGLREKHKLLDIGCGSLRGGRLFIPYLNPGNYYGVEPNDWLIRQGIDNEIGDGILHIKFPHFINSSKFEFHKFEKKFDFVLAQSIFSHTPPKLLKKCLSNLRDVTHCDTVFAFTYFPGDNTPAHFETWIGDGKVASYHSSSFRKIVNDEGWWMTELPWKQPSGQRWCVATTDITILDRVKRRLKQWSGQIYRL